MNQKHIIFFNTKGGVGKSTLCDRSAAELIRLGYAVSVDNIDQQVHVNLIPNPDAEFCLYDTMGSYRSGSMDLLRTASEQNDEVVVILPTGTGKNDFKDIEFIKSCLEKYDLVDRSIFVFTKTNRTILSYIDRHALLTKMGLNIAKYIMPRLEDFGEERDTPRTRNEISQFIHEVIL